MAFTTTQITTLRANVSSWAQSDENIAIELNDKSVPKFPTITTLELLTWAGANTLIPAINTAQTSGNNTTANAARAFMILLNGSFASVDIKDTVITGILNALRTGGVITLAQQNDLDTRTQRSISLLASIGITRPLDFADIPQIRP